MEEKLIKTVDGYELFTQGFLKASTNHGLIDSLNIEEGSIRYKLSLKNCQAIANGYDSGELAHENAIADKTIHLENGLHRDSQYIIGLEDGFRAGFQKALEILGDKKFSEEQMINAFKFGWERRTNEKSYYQSYEDFFVPLGIPSKELQQTEWGVEIEMEIISIKYDGGVSVTADSKPKLDADGCIILKRK